MKVVLHTGKLKTLIDCGGCMEVTADTRTNERDVAQKIKIPGLTAKIAHVELPATVTTQTIIKSTRTGTSSKNEAKDIPFEARVEISNDAPKKILGLFGLKETPASSISLGLSVESSELHGKLSSHYKYLNEWTENVSVRTNYVPSGQHTPYGPKDSPGYWEYSTEAQNRSEWVDKTESVKSHKLSQSEFNYLYLALLNAPGSEKKAELLGFIHENFGALARDAHVWIGAQLKEKVKAAQKVLESEASEFEGLKLPKI